MAKTKPEDAKPQFHIGRSEAHHLLYSDGVRIVMGGYDLKLILSTAEKGPDGTTYITEHLTLVLSPQHAKDLAEKLSEQVAVYERDFMPLEFRDIYQKRLEEKRKAMEDVIKLDDDLAA